MVHVQNYTQALDKGILLGCELRPSEFWKNLTQMWDSHVAGIRKNSHTDTNIPEYFLI
jgi:hypothetical protein